MTYGLYNKNYYYYFYFDRNYTLQILGIKNLREMTEKFR